MVYLKKMESCGNIVIYSRINNYIDNVITSLRIGMIIN